MVSNANHNTQQSTRLAAAAQQRLDSSGEYLWPLTSAGAAGIRTFTAATSEHAKTCAYPAKPQTLCDAEPNRRGCPGMVAEPLN